MLTIKRATKEQTEKKQQEMIATNDLFERSVNIPKVFYSVTINFTDIENPVEYISSKDGVIEHVKRYMSSPQ